MSSAYTRARRAGTMFLSLLLTTLVTSAQAAPAFEATIEEARAVPGGVSLMLVADLAGYGPETRVSTGAPAVLDEQGFPVRVEDLAPGQRVRVEFDGGFLESYPLQVRAKRITRLAERQLPTMQGFVVEFEDRGMIWTSSQLGGRTDMIYRFSEATRFEKADGSSATVEEARRASRLEATFDGMILESMPPQINCSVIRILE